MFVGRQEMAVTGTSLLEKSLISTMSISGGLAIGVPGELRAYQKAYEEFGGGVTWRELFEPTIRLCREGFIVSSALAGAIKDKRSDILNDPGLRFILNNYILWKN